MRNISRETIEYFLIRSIRNESELSSVMQTLDHYFAGSPVINGKQIFQAAEIAFSHNVDKAIIFGWLLEFTFDAQCHSRFVKFIHKVMLKSGYDFDDYIGEGAAGGSELHR